MLIAPLRLFLSLPGRTERQLGEKLAAIGAGFRLVDPIEGTHELDRPLRGKRIVHVADRIEPGLLAIDALRWPDSLVVVPQRLFDRVADYRETFADAVGAAADITLLSDDELVGLAVDARMGKDDA
ncbi:hypothetical protein Ate01nite_25110 [Actinoplanes teichomyceticus]|nr:hypothetical protein Ate01nite_25110 [Actinoplanes teichomyceticus]